MESDKAIICLTRGYSNTQKYNALILRNVAIYETFNSKFNYQLIIFHEGNIPNSHQDYITERSMGQKIRFISIADTWAGGYEGMCKFFIYDLWNYCKNLGLEYVLRIDEDCVLQKVVYNPFEQLQFRPKLAYLTSVFWAESHSETNATLPQFIQEITGAKDLSFYNDKYPYTNVGIARVSYMTRLHHYLKLISESPLQRANRWGDLPVLGALFNIFFPGMIGTMDGLSYYHSSHNMSITCESNGVD